MLFSSSASDQEKVSAEIRREFFRTKSQVNFAGDVFVDFFGPFSLDKNRRTKSTKKNPRQNSNRNLGVSRPKSTLQINSPPRNNVCL